MTIFCLFAGLDDKLDGEDPGVLGDGLKKNKRRKPRMKPKSQLEDSFPAYLQEAFFGRPLMDKSKDSEANTSHDLLSDHDDEKTNDSAIHSSSTLDAKDPFEFPESPEKKYAQHLSGALKIQQGTIPPTSLPGTSSDPTHDDPDKEHMGDEDLSSFLPVAPDMPDDDIMSLLAGDKIPDSMCYNFVNVMETFAIFYDI